MIAKFARIVDHIRNVRIKWIVVTSVLVVVVISAIFTPLVFAANDKIDSSSRLVTFYDNGKEKTIITKGKTVRDALADAEIQVADNDKVSPAVGDRLDGSMAVVSIKRARPVTVTDSDGRRSRIVTSETDASTIAKQANLAMKSHDTVEMSVIDDFTSAGGVGQQMVITRAKTVNFVLYGQPISLRTQQKTVRAMLREANIQLSPDDTASIDLDTPIAEGMNFQIWRNGIQTVEQTEDVPFETQTIEDSTKKIGYSEIQTVGQNGKKTVIYQVDMQNGVEAGRQKISEVITVPAVTQVVVKGTKVELPPGSHTDWMAMAGIPESDYGATNYIISRESGWRYNASNPSGAYGLPQCMTTVHKVCNTDEWRTNPIAQLAWFYNYCKGRYGSVQGAYEHWLVYHSY